MPSVARVVKNGRAVVLLRFTPEEVRSASGGVDVRALSGLAELAGGDLEGKLGRKIKRGLSKALKGVVKLGKGVLNAYTGGAAGALAKGAQAALTKDGGAVMALDSNAAVEAGASAAMAGGALTPWGGGALSRLPKWAIPAAVAGGALLLLRRRK
jgi:hypothetical protein